VAWDGRIPQFVLPVFPPFFFSAPVVSVCLSVCLSVCCSFIHGRRAVSPERNSFGGLDPRSWTVPPQPGFTGTER
jgi:hypothetical protein